jgi:uncharacterized protein YajQ (UPF0234 family)|tara:strand:+ start:694 stop:933 length:240 start_codon:yes stop_codon:yes gene_type:complete
MDNNAVKEINFDGKVYLLADLTQRAVEAFSILIRAQQKANELAGELAIVQAGQNQITENIRNIIKEDKIKVQPKIEKVQ